MPTAPLKRLLACIANGAGSEGQAGTGLNVEGEMESPGATDVADPEIKSPGAHDSAVDNRNVDKVDGDTRGAHTGCPKKT